MMFLEAYERMNKPLKEYSGNEYDGTDVGNMLNMMRKYHGGGDAYMVEYRELLASGHVEIKTGIANHGWITKLGCTPGIEIIRLKPTISTATRWAIINTGVGGL